MTKTTTSLQQTRNEVQRDTSFKLTRRYPWDHHDVVHTVLMSDEVLASLPNDDQVLESILEMADQLFNPYYWWEFNQRGAD